MGALSKDLISVTEAAKILRTNRVQIIRLIKQGEIKATKVGNAYVIDKKSLGFSGIYKKLTTEDKKKVEKAVTRTIKEYGDVLRKLGRE